MANRFLGGVVVALFLLTLGGCPKKEHPGKELNEHPGEEHQGKEQKKGEEHPGEEQKQEHPGKDESKLNTPTTTPTTVVENAQVTPSSETTTTPPNRGVNVFTAADIKAAMHAHIQSKLNELGVFHIKDPKTGLDLALQFVKIHDPVRKLNDGYFACTDFEVVGSKGKLYDLDFWLYEEGGQLVARDAETKIHKEPAQQKEEWIKVARYTFEGEKIVEIK